MKTVLILFFIIVAEFLLEALIVKKYFESKSWFYRVAKQHHFSLLKYLIFFGVPFITVMFFILRYDSSALLVFLSFAIIGTFAEWVVGYSYYNVVGKRLWTYHKFDIDGHTSLLSIPLWGIAGVIFWLTANVI